MKRVALFWSLVLGPWSLVLPLSADQPTIVFPMVDLTGSPVARQITLTPRTVVSQVGTNIAVGPSLIVPATNTAPAVQLVPGKWTASFEGLAATFTFNVPNTNGVYLATDPALAGTLPIYQYTNSLGVLAHSTNYYTRPEVDALLASGGIAGALTNGFPDPIFAGNVTVSPDEDGLSALTLGTDGIYSDGAGTLWLGFAQEMGIDLGTGDAQFAGQVTAIAGFHGAFAGDGAGLTNLPPQTVTPTYTYTRPLTAPLFQASGNGALSASLINIAGLGNGWVGGVNPGGTTRNPPFTTVTNWYPQLHYTADSPLLDDISGTGWAAIDTTFATNSWFSTNLLFLVCGGTWGGTDYGHVTNILARASNAAASVFIVTEFPSDQGTNNQSAWNVRTNWASHMSALYPTKFVDPTPYLQTKTNGTAADAQYVAKGALPLSLYDTNEASPWGHLTPTGYLYMSDAIAMVVSNSTVSGFVGNGAGLTNVPAAAVVGIVTQTNWPASAITNAPWQLTNSALLLTNGEFGTTMRIELDGITAPDQILITNAQNGTWARMRSFGFTGDGSGLTNLSAGNLTGTIPIGVFAPTTVSNASGAFYQGDGISRWRSFNLGSGTNLPDTALSTNVALLNGTNVFSGTNRFTGPVTLTNAANVISGAGLNFTGSTAATNWLKFDQTGVTLTNNAGNYLTLNAAPATAYAIWVNTGSSYFGGAVQSGTSIKAPAFITTTGGSLDVGDTSTKGIRIMATNATVSGGVTLSNVLALAPISALTTTNGTIQIYNSNNAALYARGTNGVDKVLLTFP